jgi:hypothetical protein
VTSSEFTTKAFQEAYGKHFVVHLLNAGAGSAPFTWRDVLKTFNSLNDQDRASWCIESKDGVAPSPSIFLQPLLTKDRAYGSFLVQHGEDSYKQTLARLPIQELRCTELSYERAIWFFFGRNRLGNEPLQGRPEHTDSITHDGTWHFQLSGRKQWLLRPTSELLKMMETQMPAGKRQRWTASTRVSVDCDEGSVLVTK